MKILEDYQLKHSEAKSEIASIQSLLLSELDAHRLQVLQEKREEYAIDSDRYRNFFDGSEVFRNLTGRFLKSSDYLVALMCKHLVCIEDMMFNRTKNITKSLLLEKFGDALNYLEILKSMIIDKKISTDCTVDLFALDERLKRDYLFLSERLIAVSSESLRKIVTV